MSPSTSARYSSEAEAISLLFFISTLLVVLRRNRFITRWRTIARLFAAKPPRIVDVFLVVRAAAGLAVDRHHRVFGQRGNHHLHPAPEGGLELVGRNKPEHACLRVVGRDASLKLHEAPQPVEFHLGQLLGAHTLVDFSAEAPAAWAMIQ